VLQASTPLVHPSTTDPGAPAGLQGCSPLREVFRWCTTLISMRATQNHSQGRQRGQGKPPTREAHHWHTLPHQTEEHRQRQGPPPRTVLWGCITLISMRVAQGYSQERVEGPGKPPTREARRGRTRSPHHKGHSPGGPRPRGPGLGSLGRGRGIRGRRQTTGTPRCPGPKRRPSSLGLSGSRAAGLPRSEGHPRCTPEPPPQRPWRQQPRPYRTRLRYLLPLRRHTGGAPPRCPRRRGPSPGDSASAGASREGGTLAVHLAASTLLEIKASCGQQRSPGEGRNRAWNR